MSNRYWNKGSDVAMCEHTKQPCPYPYGYCSVCPIDNSDGNAEQARFWDEKRKPELEERRKQRLRELDAK